MTKKTTPTRRNKILADIEAAEQALEKAEHRLKCDKGRQKLKCNCGASHQINKLVWYDFGHEYNYGWDPETTYEFNWLCPTCSVFQRVLWDNNDVEWSKRKEYANDPEAQFEREYKEAFAEHKTVSEKEWRRFAWQNNYYLDKNRAKFGLVEKRK